MWLCDTEIMCQKHLCGEHLEMHMFVGAINKGKKMDGYLKNNCLEPRKLYIRHKELADEMIRRGYNHKSPIYDYSCHGLINWPTKKQDKQINKETALKDLLERCPKCRKRNEEKLNGNLKKQSTMQKM